MRRDARPVALRESNRKGRPGAPVGERSPGFNESKTRRIAGRLQCLGEISDCLRGRGIDRNNLLDGSKVRGLLAQLVGQEATPDESADGAAKCSRLATSERRTIGPARSERREDGSVAIDLKVGRADIVQPPDRLETDRSGVAQDDETADAIGGAVESSATATLSDPIPDLEVAALDPDVEAIPGQREHAISHHDGLEWVRPWLR